MAENEKEETQEIQETQNTAPEPEDLEAIKAQLEEERQAKAAAEAALAEKDNRITELESSLSEANTASEALAAELSQVKEANVQAVSKYLDVVRSANPTIPQDVIVGDTIENIDAALAKAVTIAESVKSSLEAQAKETRVPAGAPTRTEISTEGLSPREKIAAGIQQKGGTS
jgi:chromosome segregation ATPase